MKGKYTILFGDIVGFSQLLETYGEKSEELKSRHKSIIYTLCEKYNGELLNFFTDSTKVVFKNTVNAMKFALAVQKKFSFSPVIPYRICINVSDIEYHHSYREEWTGIPEAQPDGCEQSAAVQCKLLLSPRSYWSRVRRSDCRCPTQAEWEVGQC